MVLLALVHTSGPHLSQAALPVSVFSSSINSRKHPVLTSLPLSVKGASNSSGVMTTPPSLLNMKSNFWLKAEEIWDLPGEGSSVPYPLPTPQPVLQLTSWLQWFEPSSPPLFSSDPPDISSWASANQSHLLLSLPENQFHILGHLVSFQIGINVHEDTIEGGDGNSRGTRSWGHSRIVELESWWFSHSSNLALYPQHLTSWSLFQTSPFAMTTLKFQPLFQTPLLHTESVSSP